MNDPLTIILASKNIFNTNDIKRKHSNTYLYFQNYRNTIKINPIPKIKNIMLSPSMVTKIFQIY